MLINGVRAIATGITVIVVLVAKFIDGAWITVLVIPTLIAGMVAVNRHFRSVAKQIEKDSPLSTDSICDPLVVVPIQQWNIIRARGMRFAPSLSSEIIAVHVQFDDDKPITLWRHHGKQLVEEPARKAGLPLPELVCINSPFRYVITPIVDYVLDFSGGAQVVPLRASQ
jgi:hypothetical protein